jgi:hypothetical protein
VPFNSQKKETLMKQNMNKNSPNRDKFTSVNLANSIQEKSLSIDDMTQKNKELQQKQTLYLNRVLEAYGDCV